MIKFRAYFPTIKVISANQGGGFQFQCEVSEDSWQEIKDINDPKNKNLIFEVTLEEILLSTVSYLPSKRKKSFN